MKYLNLGCGSNYHKSWTNIDFNSDNDLVLSYNLLKGIPFNNKTFDVIYHSHVLEHFSKDTGEVFLEECYRVLKPGGIIRVAVPDLEIIAREYLKNLELAVSGNEVASYNYDWIKLEMYDQAVRNESGGEMRKYLCQNIIPNEDYVFKRIGEEGRNLRKNYLKNKKYSEELGLTQDRNTKSCKKFLKTILLNFKSLLIKHKVKFNTEIEIGRFRSCGEIHQWMYDRYSLETLLIECGFKEVKIRDAFTSYIHDWNNYELDSKDNVILKPDSLFMEAVK